MKTFVFEFKDLDGAIEFHKRCTDMGANTEEARQDVLVQMAAEGFMERVSMTGRSKEKVIEEMSRHSKILHVTADEDVTQ